MKFPHAPIEYAAWRPTSVHPWWGFWVRIYGYGPFISTKPRDDALFSERYGYRRVWYLFGLRFEWLRPVERFD